MPLSPGYQDFQSGREDDPPAATPDCLNCGPTEKPIFGKGLCVKCWKIDKVRRKFDPKPRPAKFKWDAKKVATLRYFRVGLKQKLPIIAAYLGCTVWECRLACKRYKVDKNSRGPYARD